MKSGLLSLAFALLALPAFNAAADTHYVDLNSPSPTPPYTNWPTAATNIQDAVDAADAGDTVLVTNGVYATGGKAVYGTLTNRVAVTKAVSVVGLNGPGATYIQGYQMPGTTNGIGAVRCAYLTNGAVLAGFSLLLGATQSSGDGVKERFGGGVWCEGSAAVITNCVVQSCVADQYGGGVYRGQIEGCEVVGNRALYGGGVAAALIRNSVLASNTVASGFGWGGGCIDSTAIDCTLIGNSAHTGGGAYSGMLTNCLLLGNSAVFGGGAGSRMQVYLNSCVVASNTATTYGGGVYWASGTNNLIDGNICQQEGGGAYNARLFQTTLTNNIAASGGGAASSVLLECLLVTNRISSSSGRGGGAFNSSLTNCYLVANNGLNAGGGAAFSTLSYCTLSNNVANSGAGSYSNTVWNSLLVANRASAAGGGAYGGTLYNSTLVGNSANLGNGGYLARLTNCISYFNGGGPGANYWQSTLAYCCTTPFPAEGVGCITNAPMFMNTNGWSDLRLQSNSPCINAGNNAYVSSGTDLDGSPRIAGGTVDMGAYEFQSPSSVLSYAWAQQYGLPTDGSADFLDTDGEGANNWQEWRADTVPTNAASALRMAGISNAPTGLAVTWDSVTTRSYWLERADDLGAAPPFQTVATNLPGVAGPKTFTDTSATNDGPYFYRVGVQ